MLEKQTKIEILKEKLNKETIPYKKEQLENKIALLNKKLIWDSSKGTYRKEKK